MCLKPFWYVRIFRTLSVAAFQLWTVGREIDQKDWRTNLNQASPPPLPAPEAKKSLRSVATLGFLITPTFGGRRCSHFQATLNAPCCWAIWAVARANAQQAGVEARTLALYSFHYFSKQPWRITANVKLETKWGILCAPYLAARDENMSWRNHFTSPTHSSCWTHLVPRTFFFFSLFLFFPQNPHIQTQVYICDLFFFTW